MAVCKNCGNKWSWAQTLKKSTFIFVNGIICPYCKEKQYISASSRKKTSVLTLFIFIPFLMNIFFDLSFIIVVVFAFIIGLIIIGINPFIIKLSNEEESFF